MPRNFSRAVIMVLAAAAVASSIGLLSLLAWPGKGPLEQNESSLVLCSSLLTHSHIRSSRLWLRQGRKGEYKIPQSLFFLSLRENERERENGPPRLPPFCQSRHSCCTRTHISPTAAAQDFFPGLSLAPWSFERALAMARGRGRKRVANRAFLPPLFSPE